MGVVELERFGLVVTAYMPSGFLIKFEMNINK